MSMDYIRKTYEIDCKRGQRVRYSPPGEAPREGKIVGARWCYLLIKLDSPPGMVSKTRLFHPTWCLQFLSEKQRGDADDRRNP